MLCTICVQNPPSHIGFQDTQKPNFEVSVHSLLPCYEDYLIEKEGWDHPGSTSMFSGMIEKTSPPDKLVLHTFEKRKNRYLNQVVKEISCIKITKIISNN